jgi:hypothetical protein
MSDKLIVSELSWSDLDLVMHFNHDDWQVFEDDLDVVAQFLGLNLAIHEVSVLEVPSDVGLLLFYEGTVGLKGVLLHDYADLFDPFEVLDVDQLVPLFTYPLPEETVFCSKACLWCMLMVDTV